MISGNLRQNAGFGMLEVLITLIIVLTGLLGLAGLLTLGQQAEMESYQRSQALVLLEDMESRINANRKLAASYAGFIVGTSAPAAVTCPGAGTGAIDKCQWHTALLGAAETKSGSSIGAMIGARGCVILTATDTYLVSVAWQGLSPTFAPPAGLDCGKDLYGNDAQRRVVSTTLRIADLDAP
jgi:type IV pilus assembly protein PilV